MSMVVRVVKKHAEYGEHQAFNWKSTDFFYLLTTLDCSIHGDAYEDEFECDIKDYERALDFLKEYKEKGDCEEIRDKLKNVFCEEDITNINGYIKELGGIDNVIRSMQYLYDERDKKYEYITFVVW